MERVIDEDKIMKEKREKVMEVKKNKHEKMENYAKLVKEMHFPEVSQRKRDEMTKLKGLMQ